ncbi:MAG: helix-turn-helix domain-containing protein [Betaproteobacteria bacterium]|nr:helix-turn-helix domain-containing protein [Betaproteobacteria bacterium]
MSSEALQGIGPKLAATRAAKGLSTAEVAAKLRLGVRQVEALEADAFEQLPGEVFVRGFVRNYARFLELDPEELLPSQEVAVAEQLTVPSTNVRFQPSPLQRWLLLPLGSAVLFFALVALLYAWLSSGEQAVLEQPALEEHQALQQPVPVSPIVESSADAAPVVAGGEPSAQQPATAVPQATEAPAASLGNATTPANRPSVVDVAKPVMPPLAASAPASANTPPLAAMPSAPAKTLPEAAKPAAPALAKPAAPIAAKFPAAPAAATAPVAVPVAKPAPAPLGPAVAEPAKPAGTHKLVFQPAEDSWVQVIDGGGQRYSKLIRAGSSESLNGTPPFRMVIGNAATMRLSHDGKTVDLRPFIGEKVARLKLSDEGASKMAPPAGQNP